MSPLKVCVEFLLLGQPFGVPGQHGFCHLATFGGDMGVPAKSLLGDKSLLARPTYCCSDVALACIIVYCFKYLSLIESFEVYRRDCV